MKKRKLYGYFFYLGLAAVYLAAVGLMFLFFDNITVRNDLVTKYRAEIAAFSFMESFRQDELTTELEATEWLRGFGIYKPDGSKIFTWREAPETLTGRLPAPVTTEAAFVFDSAQNSLRLVRRIGMGQGIGMGMKRMLMNDTRAPAFLFMEQEIPDYWKGYRLLFGAKIVLPIFLFIIMCSIAFLYKKNRDYRKHLETNSELIRLGEISRTLAHEIKNPLSAIRLQTGLLKKTLGTAGQEEVKIIEEEVQRLGTLTGRIGDFLRAPEGNPEKIHLEAFVGELCKRFNFDIRVYNHLNHDPVIHFDSSRLRSVLENIIKNGIESYTGAAASITPHLEINITAEGNYPVLSILDQGSGMAPDMHKTIFAQGGSAKEAGSGIGLAIAKRFVEAMEGTITLLPRTGGGTEVKILFRKV